MSKSFDTSHLKKFAKALEEAKGESEGFMADCAKVLGAKLLEKANEHTPVGDYSVEVQVTAKRDSKNHKKGDIYTKRINPSGKMGGTLKDSWKLLPVSTAKGITTIEIINPVEYASYVEYGHRQEPGRYVPAIGKKLKKAWVPGHFMMKNAVEEVESIKDRVIQAKMDRWLRSKFK